MMDIYTSHPHDRLRTLLDTQKLHLRDGDLLFQRICYTSPRLKEYFQVWRNSVGIGLFLLMPSTSSTTEI